MTTEHVSVPRGELGSQLEVSRVAFEEWHNAFYGTVGVRSLERYPEHIGLGYLDETVQAQFALFHDLRLSRATPSDEDDGEGGNCEVCGSPVRYGSRHHRCGDAMLRAEKRGRESATPSHKGEVVVTKNEQGQIVAVTRQDEDGQILSVIAESTPSAPHVVTADDVDIDFILAQQPVFEGQTFTFSGVEYVTLMQARVWAAKLSMKGAGLLPKEETRSDLYAVMKIALKALERCANDTLDGRNAADELRAALATLPHAAVPEGWQPIDTAPRNNELPLYLARFDDAGQLQEIDFDGSWEYWQESWEMSHINGYDWHSANGIEEPTHWAYQSAAPQSEERG